MTSTPSTTATHLVDARRFQRLVAAAVILLVAIVMIMVAYTLAQHRKDIVAQIALNAQNLARVNEEHARGSINAVDVALASVARAMQILPGRHKAKDPEIHTLLRANLQSLPHVRAFWILDAEGNMIHDSDNQAGTYNLSDRAHFQVHRDDDKRGMYVAPPILSRLKVWSLDTSRRVDNPDGSFGGIVAAAIEPHYFETYYGALDVGALDSFALLGLDGSVIARSPHAKDWLGKAVGQPGGLLEALRAADAGTYRARSAIDQVERVYAYRRVTGRELVVLVGMNEGEFLAVWRATALRTSVAAAVFLVLLAWLGVKVMRGLTRRGVLNRALTESAMETDFAATSGQVGLWRWNLKTNEVHFSKEWKRQLGYAPDEVGVDYNEWFHRLHPDDAAHAQALGQMLLQPPHTPFVNEYRLRHKDGSYRWILSHGSLMHDERGEPLRVLGSHVDITAQRESTQAALDSREALRALLARFQSAQEEERTRIAREVHDELGQQLTGVKLDLRWLERRLSDADAPVNAGPLLDRVVAASSLNDQTIETVQKLAARLRPSSLDLLGLAPTLRAHTRIFSQRSGIACTVDIQEDQAALSGPQAIELFYIFQEALTNVARHAQAQHVIVRLRQTDSQVRLDIEDDGVGCDVDALRRSNSLGLLGMRERANHYGGAIELKAVQPHGTCVIVTLPTVTDPSVSKAA